MFQDKRFIIGCGVVAVILIIALILIILKPWKKNEGVATPAASNKITLWTPIDDASAYDPFIEALRAEKVTLEVVQKDAANYEAEVIDAIAGGSGPDIWLVRNDWFTKHHSKLSLMAETSTESGGTLYDFKKQYITQVAQELIVNNGIYGVPLSADPLVLYYNPALFEPVYDSYTEQARKTGKDMDERTKKLLSEAPKTWDDFLDTVKLFNAKSKGTKAVAMGTSNNINDAPDILYLLMHQNGTIFTSPDQKSAAFQLPSSSAVRANYYPGTKALEFYTNFALPKSGVYSWSESMPDALTAFMEGKIAMMIGYSSFQKNITQLYPNLSYEVLPIPQVKQTLSPVGFVKYWAMGVNRNSKNGSLAWYVVNYLAQSSNRSEYLRATKRYPITSGDLPTLSEAKANSNSIESQIVLAKPVFKPDAARYDSVIAEMITNVVRNKQTPQTSIEAAANTITTFLQGGR